MAQSVVLRGADIKVYLAGTLYKEVQGITYNIDIGEEAIYGIDSVFPQEITTTRVSVSGSITAVYTKGTGGPQGYSFRSQINEVLQSPYISLRIHDRDSDEQILFIPQAKIVNEQLQMATKGTAKLTLAFKGIIPRGPTDLG